MAVDLGGCVVVIHLPKISVELFAMVKRHDFLVFDSCPSGQILLGPLCKAPAFKTELQENGIPFGDWA